MELTTMKNIGTEMKRKLNAAGITSAEELSTLGSKESFVRLKLIYPEVCLVHLYALQGAIDNVDIKLLSQDTKTELTAFSNHLK